MSDFPKIISTVNYTIYTEKSFKKIKTDPKRSLEKIKKLDLRDKELYSAPQTYFVSLRNPKNSILYTFGLGPCYALVIYIDNGPAILAHVDTDSLLCPVFIIEKLYEMISEYGSNRIKIVFVEPDTKGKKIKFSHVLVYNFFRFLKKNKGFRFRLFRCIIPASIQVPINMVLFENNKLYFLSNREKGEKAIVDKLIIASTGINNWNISCVDEKQDFSDDYLWHCPVKNRFTRGISGSSTFDMNLKEITNYISSNVNPKIQKVVLKTFFKNIIKILSQLRLYNKKTPELNKTFEIISQKVIKGLVENMDKLDNVKFMLKKVCGWLKVEKSKSGLIKKYAKFMEELYLHSFVNIIHVAIEK